MKPASRTAVLPKGDQHSGFGASSTFLPPSENGPELVPEPLCTTGLSEQVFGRCVLLRSLIWANMLEVFEKNQHMAGSLLSNRKP